MEWESKKKIVVRCIISNSFVPRTENGWKTEENASSPQSHLGYVLSIGVFGICVNFILNVFIEERV